MLRSFALLALCALAGCAGDAPSSRDAQAPDASLAGSEAIASAEPCVQRAPGVEVQADPDQPVTAGTPVTYRVTIENRDTPSCEPTQFSSSISSSALASLPFHVEPAFVSTDPLEGGQRTQLSVVVSSAAEEEAGAYPLAFFVRSAQSSGGARVRTAEATYTVRGPEGCHVAVGRELLIRHPSVVDDPLRTSAAHSGAWSFGELLRRATLRPDDAPRQLERVLRSFSEEQTINGLAVAPRPNMQRSVLDPWPRTPQGELDLARAPLRLLAIAHRLDLGEGRFVFGVLDQTGGALLFTLILEYALPGSASAWAQRVHALGALPFPGEAYNRALVEVTERFAARDAAPGRPNGSALLRVRTNENALGRDGRWQMRELRLSAETGQLEPAALALTPDRAWNGSARLSRFIADNLSNILSETHELPAQLEGQPFLAGSLINDLSHWDASADPEARRKFSLNTCDGCHGGETFTSFFHVFPRAAGEQSKLSSFLTGVLVRDPVSGEEQTYNELARRRELLERSVCQQAD